MSSARLILSSIVISMALLGCGDEKRYDATTEKIRELRAERRVGADNLHIEDSLWLSLRDVQLHNWTKDQRRKTFIMKTSIAAVEYELIDQNEGALTYLKAWKYTDAISPWARSTHTWRYGHRLGQVALSQPHATYWASIALGFFEQASDDATHMENWALLDTVNVLETQFRKNLAEALPDSMTFVSARAPGSGSSAGPIAAGALLALVAGGGFLIRRHMTGRSNTYYVRTRAHGKPLVIEVDDGKVRRLFQYLRSYRP